MGGSVHGAFRISLSLSLSLSLIYLSSRGTVFCLFVCLFVVVFYIKKSCKEDYI